MTSLFEDLLRNAYIDASQVWELVKYMCNHDYGPNCTFSMGRNFDDKGAYFAQFCDSRSISDSPVDAICRAASKAMEE